MQLRIALGIAGEKFDQTQAAMLAGLLAQAHHGFIGCTVTFVEEVESEVKTVTEEVEAVAHQALAKIKELFGMDAESTPEDVLVTVEETAKGASAFDEANDALKKVAIAVGAADENTEALPPVDVVAAVQAHAETAAANAATVSALPPASVEDNADAAKALADKA